MSKLSRISKGSGDYRIKDNSGPGEYIILRNSKGSGDYRLGILIKLFGFRFQIR